MRIFISFDWSATGVVELKASELEVFNSILNRIQPTEYHYGGDTEIKRRKGDHIGFTLAILRDNVKLLDYVEPEPTPDTNANA